MEKRKSFGIQKFLGSEAPLFTFFVRRSVSHGCNHHFCIKLKKYSFARKNLLKKKNLLTYSASFLLFSVRCHLLVLRNWSYVILQNFVLLFCLSVCLSDLISLLVDSSLIWPVCPCFLQRHVLR